MAETLPARASLAWLRKTAKQRLRDWRRQGRDAALSEALRSVARQYGFASWRALKAHIEGSPAAGAPPADETEVASFLRRVGDGDISAVRAALAAEPRLVAAVGPHPFWGGSPQALHVAIETRRRDMFDLLLAAGADVDGSNEHYDGWSPLMLTVHWSQPEMRRILVERGARVGLVEALLFEDDARVAEMLRAGAAALPPDAFEPSAK